MLSKKMAELVFLVIFLIGNCSYVWAGEIEETKAFFNKYINLSHSYDKAVLDMYSDNAVIKRHLTYPDGKTKTIIIPAQKFKSKLRFYLPMAKLIGYKNVYYNLKYIPEGNNIRLTGTRQVVSDKYTSPISMLIGKDSSGKLAILEDITNTKAAKLLNNL